MNPTIKKLLERAAALRGRLGSVERLRMTAVALAILSANAFAAEKMELHGWYTVEVREAIPEHRSEYNRLWYHRLAAQEAGLTEKAEELTQRLAAYERVKSRRLIPNLVVTVGKNYILDNGLAGSSFTAAYYLGLITTAGFSAYNAADTMASHADWAESTVYSQATRPAAAWSAASAGSKAFSSPLTFSINGTDTLQGCFLTTNSTKGGTTGTLISAGTFSGGTQPVVNTNTVTVSYTMAA